MLCRFSRYPYDHSIIVKLVIIVIVFNEDLLFTHNPRKPFIVVRKYNGMDQNLKNDCYHKYLTDKTYPK